MVMYLYMGDLKGILAYEKEARATLSQLSQHSYVKAHVNAFASTCLLAGRYTESEKSARESLSIMQRLGDMRGSLEPMRSLSWALALQGKFDEAGEYCTEHLRLSEQSGNYYVKDEGHGREVWGTVLMLQGRYDEARVQLNRSLAIKEKVKETLWIPTTLVRLAMSYEMQGIWDMALQYYQMSLLSNTMGRLLTRSEALAGILRVRYRLGDFAVISKLIQDAEALAEPNEFNDHLASLRLTQGMTADVIGLNGQTSAASQSSVESNQSVVIRFFKQAMIYALRYNRFLLDEVLSGRPQGTPLHPIIPYCLSRGEEGRKMLLALRNWWQTGVNDIGTPRPDTISPIPEGIALLEAERIAREREPGDGSLQKSVVEQIEAVLMKGTEK